MSQFIAKSERYRERVQGSFDRQGAMRTLGALLDRVQPGAVDIVFDWSEGITQQHGFVHAGMLSAALDSACGYAGLSLMAEEAAVLTIEFKVNLLAPARGQQFRMQGRVIKPGRTITVAEGHAYAIEGGQETLVATMSCTLMAVTGRSGLSD